MGPATAAAPGQGPEVEIGPAGPAPGNTGQDGAILSRGRHRGPFGIWLFHQGVAEGNPLPAGAGLGGVVEEVHPDRGEHQHD